MQNKHIKVDVELNENVILSLICEGLGVKEVAHKLGLTFRRTRYMIDLIRQKYSALNLHHLAHIVTKENLVK